VPPRGGRVEPGRVLLRDQQEEVKGVGEAEPAELPCSGFSGEEVAPLDRVLEDRVR
jgi:hypothetical protein